MSEKMREWCDTHGEPYGLSMADFFEYEERHKAEGFRWNDGSVVVRTGLLSRQPIGSEVRFLLIPPVIVAQR